MTDLAQQDKAQDITQDIRDHIAIITMHSEGHSEGHNEGHNEGRLNMLSLAKITAMQQALDDIAKNDDVHVVMLRAEGKAFCAGHDLREMQNARADADGGKAFYQELFAACSRLMASIVNLPQPVIAEVQGVATAAGTQLVASCDLAVAADHVKFGVNGIDIGLFCATPMVALTRNIARKQAFEMLSSGEFISADEAVALGLINRAVSWDELRGDTMALASKIAAKAPHAMKMGKAAFNRQISLPLDDAYQLASETMVANMLHPDTAHSIDAFINRKK